MYQKTNPSEESKWRAVTLPGAIFLVCLWVTGNFIWALALTFWIIGCAGVGCEILDARAMKRKKAREKEEAKRAQDLLKSEKPSEEPMASVGCPHPRGYGGC